MFARHIRLERHVIMGALIAATFAVVLVSPPWANAQTTNCPSLAITGPGTLPNASVGAAYSTALTFSGGATAQCPVAWSNPGGGLPPGLHLNATTGVISGTAPAQVSTATFKVSIANPSSSTTRLMALPTIDTLTLVPSPTTATGFLTNATTDGSSVFVAGPGTNAIYSISGSNPPVVQTPPALPALDFPVNVATSHGIVFAANLDGTNAVSFAPPNGNVVSAGCTHPTGIAAGQDGASSLVVVGCTSSGEVFAFVHGSSTIVSSGPLPGTNPAPSGVAWIHNRIFLVADTRNATVTLLQFPHPAHPGAATVLATVSLPAGSKPANIAYDPNNKTAYVADPGTNEVSQVKVKTGGSPALTDLGEFAVGTAPFGVAVNPSSKTLVVSNSGDSTADVISLKDATPIILYTPTVGTLPSGVAIIGHEAYVVNQEGGTVTVIDPPTQALGGMVKVTHSKRRKGAHASSASVSSDPLAPPLPATHRLGERPDDRSQHPHGCRSGGRRSGEVRCVRGAEAHGARGLHRADARSQPGRHERRHVR